MIIGITNAIAILWRESPVLFKVNPERRKFDAKKGNRKFNVDPEERIFKVVPRERIFKGEQE